MSGIFISYRRADSLDVTGRIDDRLAAHFGRDSVFLDTDTIPPGVDFREHLKRGVKNCKALLAIIGPDWPTMHAAETGTRRLDEPNDFVRTEIEIALELEPEILVVPVLVRWAEMPTESQLPESIRQLAFRNAVEVRSGKDFHGHLDRLISDLETHVGKVQSPVTASQPIKVIPKGLRSFDKHDADFFLSLLPGARDRDGLPESVGFWKTRIEETDPESTFSVGLMYGPSGCGKSSLVKAGLLPRLSQDVIAVYMEATPDETESRLLNGLRKHCPDSASNLNLTDTMALLCQDQSLLSGKKVLIVLDQFEQWLHAERTESHKELVQALRQCDGSRVQCILMVRDDFWMAATHILHELDSQLREGQNSSAVDLFPVHHAEKVLAAFGQAFGALPNDPGEFSTEQNAFLKQSVAGLAEDGKIICVRLALFAEMLKNKSWTPATLVEAGGMQGVGVTFLEETFSASVAPPAHRVHQQAARAVLKALLPKTGTNIKGEMESHDQLLAASGYASRPRDFADLMQILNSDVRLITPTDPEGLESDNDSTPNAEIGQKFYQLTHDYLVPSLREWLTRKQKETKKGRAELRLAERSAQWNAKPENRYLPSLLEWSNIRALTDKMKWAETQRKMMRKAGQVHGLRAGLVAVLFMILVFAGLGIKRATDTQRKQAEASHLVDGLARANTSQVATIIGNLKNYRDWADPELKQVFTDSAEDSNAKLHAGLALVSGRQENDGQEIDPDVLEFLRNRLLTATPAQFGPVRELLEPHKTDLTDAYWTEAKDEQQAAARRFHAACALAAFDNDNGSWNESVFAKFVAEQLVSVSPEYVGEYEKLLLPVSAKLIPALSEIFKDSTRGELARSLATTALANYAEEDAELLSDLILVADVPSGSGLFSMTARVTIRQDFFVC